MAALVAGCQDGLVLDDERDDSTEPNTEVADPPTASFTFEFEAGGDGQIVHTSGDAIEGPQTLFVRISENWRGEWDDYPVQAGDVFDLDAYPFDTWSGEIVTVVWEGPDDEIVVLDEATAPDESQ